jgi:hypothetical protein
MLQCTPAVQQQRVTSKDCGMRSSNTIQGFKRLFYSRCHREMLEACCQVEKGMHTAECEYVLMVCSIHDHLIIIYIM